MNRSEILAQLGEQSEQIRARFGIARLYLFGSAARDELREGSDIDILVGFQGPATYDGYFDLKFYLEEILGGQVDLVTEKGLRSELRPSVERDSIRVA